MIENLQDDLYQLENKQAKEAKLHAKIRSCRAKLLSSKYLKDRTCKIKLYLNYIMMIINQNIPAILRIFLNLKKKNYENLYPKQTSTAATTKFVQKSPNRKKISNEHFNICEVETSLDEILKYIHSEIINLQVMMALQLNFVSTFQMN